MQPSDLLVEVRDVNLARVGQIEPRFLDLTATLRDSAPGEWKLRLPAEHPRVADLVKPGAGLIVTGPDGVLFSGPTSTPTIDADLTDPSGIATVEGVTDDVLLWHRLVYPTRGVGDVGAQTSAYAVYGNGTTSPAETVMRAMVADNLGPQAPAGRRVNALTLAADGARGPMLQKTARFDVLGDLLREIATLAGLRFRVAQVGASLVFEVLSVRDLRKEIRFDLVNGTLASQSVATSAPGLTRAIVAGQGEGAERTLIERVTTASTGAESLYGPWGRIERFIDQRNTDNVVELAQAGDKVLTEEGSIATAVKAVPSDDLTMLYAIHWREGDRVTVVVGGQETASTVTSATFIANSSGVRVGATIGDVSDFDPKSALGKRVDDTVGRVSALERTAEASGRLVGEVSAFAGATPPKGWLLCKGQAVSRSTYADLFAVIGTTYGAGDGSSTFNLPNLNGRVPVGLSGTADFGTLGQIGGAKTHTLTTAEMPSHTHAQDPHTHGMDTAGVNVSFTVAAGTGGGASGIPNAAASWGNPSYGNAHWLSISRATATNQSTGGGAPHNNLQPYITLNYVIRT